MEQNESTVKKIQMSSLTLTTHPCRRNNSLATSLARCFHILIVRIVFFQGSTYFFSCVFTEGGEIVKVSAGDSLEITNKSLQVIESLTKPEREKGSPLTTRVWGWSRWAHQNHTTLQRERQNESKGFGRRRGSQQRQTGLTTLEYLLSENKGWMASKSQVFPGVYHSPIMWHLATQAESLLLITCMLYSKSFKRETFTNACYWGIGSIALTKYIHISSVMTLAYVRW